MGTRLADLKISVATVFERTVNNVYLIFYFSTVNSMPNEISNQI